MSDGNFNSGRGELQKADAVDLNIAQALAIGAGTFNEYSQMQPLSASRMPQKSIMNISDGQSLTFEPLPAMSYEAKSPQSSKTEAAPIQLSQSLHHNSDSSAPRHPHHLRHQKHLESDESNTSAPGERHEDLHRGAVKLVSNDRAENLTGYSLAAGQADLQKSRTYFMSKDALPADIPTYEKSVYRARPVQFWERALGAIATVIAAPVAVAMEIDMVGRDMQTIRQRGERKDV